MPERTITKVKRKLRRVTGCELQHTGYPCNSCFHTIIQEDYGHILKYKVHDYWSAVLYYRGDYKDYQDWSIDVSLMKPRLEELNNVL